MANTKIVLDRQATARVFDFGTTSASGEALVTIRKGTAAATTVVFSVEGSQTVGGDLNVTGNLNITGDINRTTVTELTVTDKTVRVNNGGTTAGAAGAGLQVEGDSDTLIGAITFHAASATKFQIGNGSAQADIVDVSSVQTLTNKTITGSQISGNIAGSAANVTGTVGVANGGTGANSLTAYAPLFGGTTGTGAVQSGTVGTSGQVLTSNGPGALPTFQNAGAPSQYMRQINISGTQDASNKTFTLASDPIDGTELVTVNGQVLNPGASNDYVLTGTSLVFQAAFTAPAATDVIKVWGVA